MPLNISHGVLTGNRWPVSFAQAHDVRGRFPSPPQALVIHYDAGVQASAVDILTRNDRIYISAHFSLGRSSRIVQMVSADEVALHAGDARRSTTGHLPRGYGGGRTFNYTALGIEIENLGWLNRWDREFAWREERWQNPRTGRWEIARTPKVPIDQCIFGRHPLRKGREMFWPKYPAVQVAALYDLVEAILAYHPSIEVIVGHDEVSDQKYDPGPAFDLDALREDFGRRGLIAAGSEHARVHTIAPGDTLWAIHRRYGIPLPRLIELNDIADPNDVPVGTELRIS